MSREAMKLALEALETLMLERGSIYDKAITALREALAEQPAQQEPVATVTSETGADISMSWWHEPALPIGTKLYTSPPAQRTWFGLTDEEINGMVEVTDLSGAYYYDDLHAVARATEAKLKEKNA